MFYYVVHICVPILMFFLCRRHHHHHHHHHHHWWNHHHFPNQNMNSRCLFLFVLKSSNIPQFFPNRKHRNSRILVVKWLKGAAPTSRRAVRCGNKNRWRASRLDPFLWGDCNPAWETCDDPSSKYKDWITCLFIAQLNAWSIHQTSSATRSFYHQDVQTMAVRLRKLSSHHRTSLDGRGAREIHGGPREICSIEIEMSLNYLFWGDQTSSKCIVIFGDFCYLVHS